MKIGQAICSRLSAVFFVASLLAGIGAVQELTVNTASAQSQTGFTFKTSKESSTGNIYTQASYRHDWTANEMTLTVELWYEKYDPETGQYTPARACSGTHRNELNYEITWSYYCTNVPSGTKVQVRATVTGFNLQNQPFRHSGSGKWTRL